MATRRTRITGAHVARRLVGFHPRLHQPREVPPAVIRTLPMPEKGWHQVIRTKYVPKRNVYSLDISNEWVQ
jgi:hypothetical protein